jgi:hypothetical protein
LLPALSAPSSPQLFKGTLSPTPSSLSQPDVDHHSDPLHDSSNNRVFTPRHPVQIISIFQNALL